MKRYVEALDRRYGPSDSVEEFLRKAQVASYEAIRPMFEAFAVNRPLTTGVIQWMLNSAWPEMYWQLYDHSLMPNGAFYGTRAACQPLSLAYNYHERTVHLVNDTLARRDVVATVRALDLQGREFFSTTRGVGIDGGASSELLSLAHLEPPTPVWFLDLRLADREGREVARNFYWLSTTEDVLDWENSLWFVTPTKVFADFSALDQLPEVTLEVAAAIERPAPDLEIAVRLTNPTDAVAFFVELRFVNARDESYLPVLWDDNYLTLLPGEERLVRARVPRAGALEGAAVVVSGWNVPEAAAALGAGSLTSGRPGSS
jgi:exo-1,4-beta-D-glucosaminidase